MSPIFAVNLAVEFSSRNKVVDCDIIKDENGRYPRLTVAKPLSIK